MKTTTQRQNLFLIGLLVLALLLAACDTAVPTASAAPTNEIAIAETIPQEEPQQVLPEPAAAAEAQPVADPIVIQEPLVAQQGNGSGPGGPGGPGQGTPAAPAGELTAVEIADLQYMREEEKLAHDVYRALYEVWGVPVFDTIAGSEQAHMNAVAYLLQSFGLEDPAAGNAPGVFTNPDLQQLYNELVARGNQSLAEALLVGGAIEEIDILDLQDSLGETQNTAVIQVFENLLAGSENHLRAFAMNYGRQTGTVYQPQFMSQDAYDAIVNGTSGRGMGPGGQGNGGGQGGPTEGRGGPTNGRGGPGGGYQK